MANSQISGVAKLRKARADDRAKWVKLPEDVKPCLISGCQEEGVKVPVLIIFGKNDEKRVGRRAVVVFNDYLCEKHATRDPKEYKPNAEQVAMLKEKIQDEPDLENMIVQFFGNHRVKPSFAMSEAKKTEGIFEPALSKETGTVVTKKVDTVE